MQATDSQAIRLSLPPQEDPVIRLSALREGAVRRLASSEQKRVEAAQKGSRDAFDALAEQHRQEIRKFLQKRAPQEQIDDLLQEIWLAAWTSIGDFDSRSRFRTWLYGIAINKCKTLYRSQQRRFQPVPLDETVLERSSSPTRVSDLEAVIPDLIDSLSDNHRNLLDLYYYGELTLPEIARLLDRNLNTVKYQFYRAHAELASRIKEDIEN